MFYHYYSNVYDWTPEPMWPVTIEPYYAENANSRLDGESEASWEWWQAIAPKFYEIYKGLYTNRHAVDETGAETDIGTVEMLLDCEGNSGYFVDELCRFDTSQYDGGYGREHHYTYPMPTQDSIFGAISEYAEDIGENFYDNTQDNLFEAAWTRSFQDNTTDYDGLWDFAEECIDSATDVVEGFCSLWGIDSIGDLPQPTTGDGWQIGAEWGDIEDEDPDYADALDDFRNDVAEHLTDNLNADALGTFNGVYWTGEAGTIGGAFGIPETDVNNIHAYRLHLVNMLTGAMQPYANTWHNGAWEDYEDGGRSDYLGWRDSAVAVAYSGGEEPTYGDTNAFTLRDYIENRINAWLASGDAEASQVDDVEDIAGAFNLTIAQTFTNADGDDQLFVSYPDTNSPFFYLERNAFQLDYHNIEDGTPYSDVLSQNIGQGIYDVGNPNADTEALWWTFEHYMHKLSNDYTTWQQCEVIGKTGYNMNTSVNYGRAAVQFVQAKGDTAYEKKLDERHYAKRIAERRARLKKSANKSLQAAKSRQKQTVSKAVSKSKASKAKKKNNAQKS